MPLIFYPYCRCHDRLSLKEGVISIAEEVVEFIKSPSMDELSDIVYAINRTVSSLIGLYYFPIIPILDRKHKLKIEERMKNYRCIRSTRHLLNGKCPSENKCNDTSRN